MQQRNQHGGIAENTGKRIDVINDDINVAKRKQQHLAYHAAASR